jgi:hypothetical protein
MLDDRPRPSKEPKILAEAQTWWVWRPCRKATDLGDPDALWTTRRRLARQPPERGPESRLDKRVEGTVRNILDVQEVKPYKVSRQGCP